MTKKLKKNTHPILLAMVVTTIDAVARIREDESETAVLGLFVAILLITTCSIFFGIFDLIHFHHFTTICFSNTSSCFPLKFFH